MSSNSFSEILNTVNTDDFGNLFKKTGGLKRGGDNDDDDGSNRMTTFNPRMYDRRGQEEGGLNNA